MARPIQPTPILKGNDAKVFLEDLDNTKPSPAVYQYLEKCQRLYEHFQTLIVAHHHGRGSV